MKRTFALIFLVAVFFSGFCSLVYQLIWDRLARFNFGGDNISATIVVTTFLLGLGLGAFLFRKPFARPLIAYGFAEICIGLFAIVSYGVITNVSLFTASIFLATADGLEGVRFATITGCFLFLLPPCILMGGTLPLMFAAFFKNQTIPTNRVGFLYGLNILGAMLGTIAVPFVLLNYFAIDQVLFAIGVINIAIGLVSVFLYFATGRQGGEISLHKEHDANAGEIVAEGKAIRGFYSLVAFATGLVTIIYEIVLIRHSFMMIPSSAYNISFVLASVLFSLGSGSMFFSYIVSPKMISIRKLVGLLLLSSTIGLLISLYTSEYMILHVQHLPNLEKLGATFIYYICVAFPLFFPLGAVFPLLCAARSSDGNSLPQQTGKLYLVNSIGALVGALLFHLLLSKWMGTQGSLVLLAVMMAAIATVSIWMEFSKAAAIPAILAAVGICFALYSMNLKPFLLGPAYNNFANFTIQEGTSGIASANWYDKIGNGALVCINGQGMGAIPNEPHDMRIMAATLAVSKPRKVLILGVATGSYIQPLLKRESIESITLVDWSHEIPLLMKKDRIFIKGKEMDILLSDKRLKFLTADARVAVNIFREESFDLIIDSLARPDWPGATGLKSPEYYKNLARILTKDGHLVLATLYRGWRNSAWSVSGWRKEIIAGVYQAFDFVKENSSAGVLIASRSEINTYDPHVINQITSEFASRSKMEERLFRQILSSGFMTVPRSELEGVKSFSEKSLESEYFYKLADVMRFI